VLRGARPLPLRRRPVSVVGARVRRAMSRLRLTGGSARGRVLPREVGAEVRPTASRVREALFSMVGHDLRGRRVLDAYGGTGLLGLEAWSRGADVVIVEQDRKTAAAIRENAASLGAPIVVHDGDVLTLVGGLGPFDGVLVDPPYRLDPEPIVAALAPHVRDWLVLELEDTRPSPSPPVLREERRRSYGGTALVVYRCPSPAR
jgi:16S rRNA (guanine966-N2)-methyltransferase